MVHGPIRLARLADATLILFDRASDDDELVRTMLREAAVSPYGVIEVDSVDTARRLVARGLGVAWLPSTAAAPEVEAGRLAAVNLADAAPVERRVMVVERAEATSWIPVRTMNRLLSDVPSYLPGAMALPAEAMTALLTTFRPSAADWDGVEGLSPRPFTELTPAREVRGADALRSVWTVGLGLAVALITVSGLAPAPALASAPRERPAPQPRVEPVLEVVTRATAPVPLFAGPATLELSGRDGAYTWDEVRFGADEVRLSATVRAGERPCGLFLALDDAAMADPAATGSLVGQRGRHERSPAGHDP